MRLNDAKAQLWKGIDDYEQGRITLSALLTLSDLTTEEVYKEGYKDGLHDAELDGDDESEVEFEADFSIEDEGEDDDSR